MILHKTKPIGKASIEIIGTNQSAITNTEGSFTFLNIPNGDYKVQVTCIGYKTQRKSIKIQAQGKIQLDFELQSENNELNEVVVSGTLKAVKRLESAVPVEVYTPVFF